MNFQYIPKYFCKDYFRFKGSSQLPMFISLIKGIKPLMDDWISVDKYQGFKEMCKKYNLKVEPDWVFLKVKESMINNAIDSNRLSTTKFYGKPYYKNIKEGDIHVFISKSEKQIKEAKKFGWYPLIVDSRSLHKPFIDHLRFGKILGYPDCCIDFFRDYNDHNKYNHLYETYKNTEGTPNFLCNNIFMDFTYSLIHHLPCSFNCKKTKRDAKELLNEIEKEEPDFAEQIRYHLKLPLLIFDLRDTYVFEGMLDSDKLSYSDFGYIGRPEDDRYRFKFRSGDKLMFKKDMIEIFKGDDYIGTIPKERGFFLRFN